MFRRFWFVLPGLGLSAWLLLANTGGPALVHLQITVEPRQGATPEINLDTVHVTQAGKTDRVRGLEPLRDGAGLQVMLLLDDGADPAIGSQFSEIKAFLNGLPAGASAGLGYIRGDAVQVAAPMSTDLGRTAGALRLPLGEFGINPSPYEAIGELAQHWPSEAPATRREIVMITPGLELLDTPGPLDPFMARAIAALQKAGIPVFDIFTPAAGHWGHVFWRDLMGQSQLSQLSDETGGEGYMMGYGVQFLNAPLKDIRRKLDNQYELSFEVQPGTKTGLQAIEVRSSSRSFDVIAADHVYVPAADH